VGESRADALHRVRTLNGALKNARGRQELSSFLQAGDFDWSWRQRTVTIPAGSLKVGSSLRDEYARVARVGGNAVPGSERPLCRHDLERTTLV